MEKEFCINEVFVAVSSLGPSDSVALLPCVSKFKKQGTVDFLKWNFFFKTSVLDKDSVYFLKYKLDEGNCESLTDVIRVLFLV